MADLGEDCLAAMKAIAEVQDRQLTYSKRLERLGLRSADLIERFAGESVGLAGCDIEAAYLVAPELVKTVGALIDDGLRLLGLFEETSEAVRELCGANSAQHDAFLEVLRLIRVANKMEPESQHDTQEHH